MLELEQKDKENLHRVYATDPNNMKPLTFHYFHNYLDKDSVEKLERIGFVCFCVIQSRELKCECHGEPLKAIAVGMTRHGCDYLEWDVR